jgi:hypothetical protein
MRRKYRTWHLLCVKWVGWKKRGCIALKARPEKGKYVPVQTLPPHVKLAFDLCDLPSTPDGWDKLECRYVRSFTNENIIKEYEESGAIVKALPHNFFRITFDVMPDWNKRKNPSAKERVKTMERDDYGRFIAS